MLRMAHKILSQKLLRTEFSQPISEDEIRQDLLASEVFIADNVSELFESRFDEMLGVPVDARAEYPCVAPPYRRMFIEYTWNRSADAKNNETGADVGGLFGWLLNATKRGDPDSATLFAECNAAPTDEWWIYGVGIMSSPITGGRPWISSLGMTAFTDAQGEITRYGCEAKGLSEHAGDSWASPALLTLSFLNCKNVVRTDASAEFGPSDKWLRRQHTPRIAYKVLDIGPMREILRTEGQSESVGIKRALHLCRGHFAVYTEEAPLFGKITGRFWKSQHVRGAASQGAVLKDYRVHGK